MGGEYRGGAVRTRTRWPAIVLLLLACGAPRAWADPILTPPGQPPTPDDIALSPTETTTIVFNVDPIDTPLSSFVLNFSAPTSGIELVSIDSTFSPTLDPANGLAGFAGTFGVDQTAPFEVGSLTVRGLLPGAQIILSANSNYTDSEFMDIPAGGPTPVAMVIPEPSALGLIGLGTFGLVLGLGTSGLVLLGRQRR